MKGISPLLTGILETKATKLLGTKLSLKSC